MTVTDGKRVSIEYTVTQEDQTQVDTNVGGEPLTYTQGEQSLLPALQKGMEGQAAGESRRIVLSPEEGYGSVDSQAFQEVELNRLPEDAQKIGTPLGMRASSGQTFTARVHEIRADTAVLDLNHPLAGKTLTFDVKVVKVEDPSA